MPLSRSGRLLALPILMALCGCVAQAPRAPAFGIIPPGGFGAPLPEGTPRNRVALLLPLTGANRALGQAMLNAAQLALFDQADPRVEFLPRDTGSTALGAAEATRAALADGARAIAGPLTQGETAATAAAARGRGVPVFAFTNDGGQAGPGVWVLGVTPGEQMDRLTAAGIAAGSRRFGLLAVDDEFGRRLALTLRARLSQLGLPPPAIQLHAPRGDIGNAARALAAEAGPDGLEAVILGAPAASARTAAAALIAALPNRPRLMGTALWSIDPATAPALAQEPALAGAWFPGPDPTARAQFDSRYATAFTERPPRLAGVAYDAAALAARSARDAGRDSSASPPLGEAFRGADGPVRLLPQGQIARGLALFAIDPGGEPRLIEGAPIPTGPGS